MKKILLLACLFVLFISCEKTTTYQIVNNSSYAGSSCDGYLDGSMYEVVVFQYIGNDIVKQDNISKISYGGDMSDEIQVDNDIEKVKVSFMMLPRECAYYELPSNKRLYVVAYSYMKEGELTRITIDDNTMVSNSLSKGSKSILLYMLYKK